MWPTDAGALAERQGELAGAPLPAFPFDPSAPVAGCFACFARGGRGRGRAGDPGWAGGGPRPAGRTSRPRVVTGGAGGPYAPGLLALREGALLEAAVRALPDPPGVLLVDGTGRDHPGAPAWPCTWGPCSASPR